MCLNSKLHILAISTEMTCETVRPSVRCQHFKNSKAPRPLGLRRWNLAGTVQVYILWIKRQNKWSAILNFGPCAGRERWPTPCGVLGAARDSESAYMHWFCSSVRLSVCLSQKCDKTNVSETTQKPPLVEAKTALGEQKHVLWDAGVYPFTKILWKETASSHKISLKSHNRLLNHG